MERQRRPGLTIEPGPTRHFNNKEKPMTVFTKYYRVLVCLVLAATIFGPLTALHAGEKAKGTLTY